MPRMRDFGPTALDKLEDQQLRIPWTENAGLKGKVRSFTVFLPRLLIRRTRKKSPSARILMKNCSGIC